MSICADDPSGMPPLTSIDGGNATFFEAVHECHTRGMRLCTPVELVGCCGCAAQQGAEGGNRHTWTLAKCSPVAEQAQLPLLWLMLVVMPMVMGACIACWCAASASAKTATAAGYAQLQDVEAPADAKTDAAGTRLSLRALSAMAHWRVRPVDDGALERPSGQVTEVGGKLMSMPALGALAAMRTAAQAHNTNPQGNTVSVPASVLGAMAALPPARPPGTQPPAPELVPLGFPVCSRKRDFLFG